VRRDPCRTEAKTCQPKKIHKLNSDCPCVIKGLINLIEQRMTADDLKRNLWLHVANLVAKGTCYIRPGGVMRNCYFIGILCIIFSLCLCGCSSKAPVDSQVHIQAVENNLKPALYIKGESVPAMNILDRMAHYKVPGVSVAVINDGEIEWAKGYGIKEAGSNDPVTPETLFQAASISKPVAALGALHLVEKGVLDLDAPVNDKLRSWKVPENEFTEKEKVTLRRLLTHSAGLTVHGFPGYKTTKEIPTTIQVLDGEKPTNTPAIRVDLIPGSQWRYSGGGYTVAQLLVTDVSGKPFRDYMKETVLNPAGMVNSTYQQPISPEMAVQAASAHRSNGKVIPGKWHVYPELAAAGLWTTPTDLCRFAIELQKSFVGKLNKVISQKMTQQMLTPGIGDWGLGPSLSGSGEAKAFSHGGGNEGFRCQLFAFIEGGRGAAVMTNSDRGSEIAAEILRSIASVYDWPAYQSKDVAIVDVDPSVLNAYVGDFRLADQPKMPVLVSIDEGHLVVKSMATGKMELLPMSETEFVYLDGGIFITFVQGDEGNFDQMKVKIAGSSMEMVLNRKKDDE